MKSPVLFLILILILIVTNQLVAQVANDAASSATVGRDSVEP